jgi:hypothetical protein
VALRTGPYPQFGDVGLNTVLHFAGWYRLAEQTSTALLRPTRLTPAIDMRGLLAAAAIAFDRDPVRYRDLDATAAVLAHAALIERKGLRSRRSTASRPDRDSAAGADLTDLLDQADTRE